MERDQIIHDLALLRIRHVAGASSAAELVEQYNRAVKELKDAYSKVKPPKIPVIRRNPFKD